MNRVGHTLLLVIGWLALAGGRALAWEPRAPDPLLFPVAEGGKLGFINAKGEVVIPLRFEAGSQAGWHGVSEGFFEGRARVTVNGKHGFIDPEGRMVIAPEYARAEHFAEGLAGVQREKDGLWSYIDRDGTVAITGSFNYLEPFSGGVAFVRQTEGGGWGLIDRAGRLIVEPRFEWTSDFSEGLGRVEIGKRYGFINASGGFVIPPTLSGASDFGNGLASAAVGGKMSHSDGTRNIDEHDRPLRYGYIDPAGKFRIPPRFDNALQFHEGLAPVAVNGSWGYVDTAGREVAPLQWDNAFTFSEGLGPVERNGLWGFVDRTGKVVIEPRFDEARPFAGGLTQVTAGDETGYLDRTGRVVWGLREFTAWGTVREIRYERFPGLHDGEPFDRLVFRRDGTAEYAAESSFPNKRPPRNRPGFGKWVGRIGTDDFRRLARLLYAERFFDLEKWYSWGLDGPSAKTTAARDDAEDRIIEHGTGAGPLPLWAVDRAIEAVAVDIVWTKAPTEAGKAEDGKPSPHRGH